MKEITTIILFFISLTCEAQNVIIILADDMGNGDISYNRDHYDTQNIDEIFNNGKVFTSYYTQSTCSPSRAAL